MRRSKCIVDVDVGKLRELTRKPFVVQNLPRVAANIFKKEYVAGFHRCDSVSRGRAEKVRYVMRRCKMCERACDGSNRFRRVATDVRDDDDARTAFDEELHRLPATLEAEWFCHLAIRRKRHIEIAPQQNLFSL